MTEQVDRDKVARLIMLDHLQLLSDFDVDGDIYRKDPECAASAYSTADAIIAALTVTPQEAAKVLLDRWLAGEFENTADAEADDAWEAGNDSIAITETWLRAISEDSQ